MPCRHIDKHPIHQPPLLSKDQRSCPNEERARAMSRSTTPSHAARSGALLIATRHHTRSGASSTITSLRVVRGLPMSRQPPSCRMLTQARRLCVRMLRARVKTHRPMSPRCIKAHGTVVGSSTSVEISCGPGEALEVGWNQVTTVTRESLCCVHAARARDTHIAS